jgi:cell shape-determining protein MreC
MEPVTATVAAAGWGIYQLLSWAVAAAAVAYGTKKVAEAYGDNAANNLARKGISPEQQFDYYKTWAEDNKKFTKEMIEEHFKDKKERLDKLEEENRKLSEKLATASPEEKVKFLEMISDNKKEMKEINKSMSDGINNIVKNFEAIGKNPPVNYQQFEEKSKQIDFSSW